MEIERHNFIDKFKDRTKICRLCLRKMEKPKDILHQNQVESLKIINIFFNICISKEDVYHHICLKCDKRLLDMQEFEKEVQEAQKYFSKLLPEDYVKVSECKLEALLIPEIIKIEKEGEVDVKSEPDQDSSNDRFEDNSMPDSMNEHFEDVSMIEEKVTSVQPKTKPKKNKKSRLTKSEAKERKDAIQTADEKINEFYNLSCNACTIKYKTWHSYKSHMIKLHTDSPRITCCDTEFLLERPILISHIDYHKNPEEFMCHLCNKQFMTLESKKMHDYRHKMSSRKNTIKKEQTKSHPCPQCGKLLSNKHCLKTHMKLHVPEEEKERQKLQCDICKKFFKNRSTILSHMNDIHRSKEKSVSCDKCAREFHSYRTFLTHYRVNHTEVKMLTCPDCGSQVKSHNMRQHKRLKHDFQPQICPICFKECRNQGYLALHNRRFHSVPKYKCDVCGKQFIIKGQWQDHYESHFNSSRFSCDQCDYVNNDYPNMIKHRKSKHPEAPPGYSKKIFQIK